MTSEYHVPRAGRIFRFVYGGGFTVALDGVPADPVATAGQREAEARSLERFETLFAGIGEGDLDAIARRLRACHDLYRIEGRTPLR